ncbi:MAG: hypothetical protein CM15mP74_23560 [Halieaceae bacterium]|nr:MAG: hypothetical protein CM15mP74_23560 [Halieaceae bacterium]
MAFSRFLETDYETGLFSGMVIVFFYAVLGGMKGITYTQIAQFCVLILPTPCPRFYQSAADGQPVPQIGLGSTLADGTYLLEKLDRTLLDLGFQEYTTSVRGSTSIWRLHCFSDDWHRRIASRHHSFLHGANGAPRRTSAGWALVFIAILTRRHPRSPPWRGSILSRH